MNNQMKAYEPVVSDLMWVLSQDPRNIEAFMGAQAYHPMMPLKAYLGYCAWGETLELAKAVGVKRFRTISSRARAILKENKQKNAIIPTAAMGTWRDLMRESIQAHDGELTLVSAGDRVSLGNALDEAMYTHGFSDKDFAFVDTLCEHLRHEICDVVRAAATAKREKA